MVWSREKETSCCQSPVGSWAVLKDAACSGEMTSDDDALTHCSILSIFMWGLHEFVPQMFEVVVACKHEKCWDVWECSIDVPIDVFLLQWWLFKQYNTVIQTDFCPKSKKKNLNEGPFKLYNFKHNYNDNDVSIHTGERSHSVNSSADISKDKTNFTDSINVKMAILF